MALYERSGTHTESFPRWIFGHLDAPPDAQVLELVSGSGSL